MTDRFAHLHVHTEFSMLDGAARVDRLVAAAVADDQPAVAITDHGVLYGVVDFTKAATKAGVKPIIGIEAYVTPGSRFDRPPRGGTRHHMTLLAENEVGYRNLLQLASKAYLEGYYYKPRMDVDLLSAHAEGLIATSGCLGGHVAQMLAPDGATEDSGSERGTRDFDGAVAVAAMYQEIFGRDNWFIEVQDHGFEAQQRVLPDLVAIADRIGAPLLAANDAHYVTSDESDAHDALLCIQTNATKDEPNRFRFNGGPEYYLKTAAQMRRLFPEDRFPGACDNTLLIAERADVRLDFGKILLPEFPVPAGHTEASYLRDLVHEGARQRWGDPSDEVRDRLDHELGIIEDMGFPAYFLIVWDLIRYARERGIRTGPGRGSAAGSAVAYALGITDLDPIEYGLIFERFLNPGRRQMPDIDMDFDERHRGEMIRYAAERYGSDHVAQIVTFSTIKGKQAVRDAARVLGHPYAVGDRISKMWPQMFQGRDATIADCLEAPDADADDPRKQFFAEAGGMRQAYEHEVEIREVLDTAKGLEGLRRQDSIHAAAVVIAPVPLTDIVPVQQKGDQAEVVTQYEMHGVEDLGLLKMDFLGLRTLTIIDRALDLIERSSGGRPDIDHVDLTDAATFELLRRGDTIGVFQLESSGLRALIRNLAPDRFDDIIAVNALYRPGALGADMHTMYVERKHGRQEVTYDPPLLEEVLGDTYGIMVYQEQVMEVARRVAGFSMAEADELRKAMGKKIAALMAEQRQQFVAGAVANGHPEALGVRLFELIEYFAGYGFNKSHSACYAYVAFQTAWLKANHPAEYMAALLTSTKQSKDRTSLYLAECRSMGIKVVPPDVNRSDLDFTVVDGEVVFGLSAVRNVGEGVVERLIEARRSGGPFRDITDFVDRVDLSVLNRRTLESLVKSGAFDGLGYARKSLLAVLDEVVPVTVERRRNEDMGQFALFGGGDTVLERVAVVVPTDEWEKMVKLSFEKEMLGLYISDHPLFGVEQALRALVSAPMAALTERPDREEVTVGGVVGAVTRRYTKAGEPMVFFQLEDLEGAVEVLSFPKTTAQFGPLVREDAVLVVKGRIDNRGEEVKVVAAHISEPRLDPSATVRIEVPASSLTPDTVGRLKAVLVNHPGRAEVLLHLASDGGHKVVRLTGYRVEPRSDLFAELRELFGPRTIVA